jgi:hypothetical protein
MWARSAARLGMAHRSRPRDSPCCHAWHAESVAPDAAAMLSLLLTDAAAMLSLLVTDSAAIGPQPSDLRPRPAVHACALLLQQHGHGWGRTCHLLLAHRGLVALVHLPHPRRKRHVRVTCGSRAGHVRVTCASRLGHVPITSGSRPGSIPRRRLPAPRPPWTCGARYREVPHRRRRW